MQPFLGHPAWIARLNFIVEEVEIDKNIFTLLTIDKKQIVSSWLDPIQAIVQTCTKGILGEILNHKWRWIHRNIVPIECDCFWQQYQSLQMTVLCKLFENWCRQAVCFVKFFFSIFLFNLDFVDVVFLPSIFNSNICHLRYNKKPWTENIAWY